VRGDLDLDPESWTKAGVTAVKPAAVLVPVVDRAAPTVRLDQPGRDEGGMGASYTHSSRCCHADPAESFGFFTARPERSDTHRTVLTLSK